MCAYGKLSLIEPICLICNAKLLKSARLISSARMFNSARLSNRVLDYPVVPECPIMPDFNSSFYFVGWHSVDTISQYIKYFPVIPNSFPVSGSGLCCYTRDSRDSQGSCPQYGTEARQPLTVREQLADN